MKRRWLSAIAMVILAAACAKAGTPAGPVGTGRLVVSQQLAKGYFEGYVAFVEVRRGGQSVFSDRLHLEDPLVHELPTGSYSLTFAVRPCDGSCDRLDPAAETCSASFSVEAGATVTAHAIERPGKSCSIELRS
jgi:hypothetical protein